MRFDPETTNLIGLALFWYGAGIVTVSIAWAVEKWREARRIQLLIRTIFTTPNESRGHVIDFHRVTRDGEEYMHAHCLCGKVSLDYETEDPTADRLMEQWAAEHIDSQMESAGK